jgi:hypothetical protein
MVAAEKPPEKASMGEILAFPIPAKPVRRRRAETAEILFFTGVRYERPADAPPVAATESGGDAPDRTSPSRRRKRRA